ncbi:Elongation factor G [compost metagenome]
MAAFREGFAKAAPQVLEPVMAVEVITPADYLGDAIGDLNRRRGLVRGQGQRGNAATVEAEVPLKEMFGYIGSLRALSSGRAQYSMQLDHYGVVPQGEMAALQH